MAGAEGRKELCRRVPTPRRRCWGPRVRAVPAGLELGCSIPEHRALQRGLHLPLTLVQSRRDGWSWLYSADLHLLRVFLGPFPFTPPKQLLLHLLAPARTPAGRFKPQHLPGATPTASSLSPILPRAWLSLAGVGSRARWPWWPGGTRHSPGRATAARRMQPLPLRTSAALARPSCTGKSTDLVVTRPVCPRSRCIYHACRAGRAPRQSRETL